MRYLFSEDQEELVGVYASQLERDLCINLFVEMMELRLNSRYCYHMFIWLIVCSLVSVYIIITFGCSLSDIIMQTHVMWVLFSVVQSFFCWLWRSQTGSIWCMISAIFNEIILQAHIFFSDNSLHTMYKLFLSAVEYLPFSSGDASKACFEEIIERFVDPGDICCNGIYQVLYFLSFS